MPIRRSGAVSPMALATAENGAGHDARHGERQDMMEDRLLVRGANAKCGLADRGRHGPERGARRDDDGGQAHQRDARVPPTSGTDRGMPKKPRKTASPSRPKMIDGTAARLLMLTSMISVNLFFGANSSR